MHKCIVIDREYGSGGREVARLLSERTGMEYYDGEKLLRAASSHGIDPALLRDNDEKGVGSAIFDFIRQVSDVTGGETAQTPYKGYEARAELFRKLAAERPCIFLGRCADVVLREETKLLTVFVFATDMEKKRARVREVDGLSPDGLPAYITRRDNQRSQYYRYFSGKTWGARENYDLCLNTSTLGYEKAAQVILTAFS